MNKNIVGETTVPPVLLFDPVDGLKKWFFIFHNISIRLTGEYLFNCQIVNIQRYGLQMEPDDSGFVQNLYTLPFTVYNNQNFPGKQNATILSVSFYNQGVPIRQKPIRQQ
ncbi:velvet factor [Globomyces pollinis-pini]|nr:velvet factor [Globomyces pollinis-pini]